MIRVTCRYVSANSDDYIYSSLNVEVSQDQKRFLLNTQVEDLNARDLAFSAVGEGDKKKTAKKNLESLWTIKDWSGLAKNKDGIKRLKVHLKMDD